MAAVYTDQLRTLRETQARLRALIDNEPECVKLLDREGRLLEMNAAGLRMIEADSAEQVLGHCVYGLVAPAHAGAFRALTERVCGGERGTLEFEIVGLKGTRRWLETHAVPFREGASGEIRLLAITRDITEHRRLQEALRSGEERFRRLTELSSDWYWEQDENFRFTLITGGPRPGRRIALPFETHLGKTRWDFPALNLSEQDWARHRAQLERHESFYDFEIQRQHADGSVLWAAVSGEPVFDAAGRFTGYRGVARDVTDRRRAEQALRESEQRFRSLTALSSDYYWETDAQHRFRELVFGDHVRPAVTAQEQFGKTRWEVPHILPDEEGWRAHRAMLDARVPFSNFEHSRTGPGGEVRTYSVSGEPRFDEAGAFVGYRGIGREITERKRAEAALRESEQRFKVFMDQLPAIAWIRDAEFRFTYVNRGYARTWGGCEPEDLVGRDAGEIYGAEIADYFRRNDDEIRQEGVPRQFVDDKPSGRWLKVKFPVPDRHGRIAIGGIAVDITERAGLEAALRESEQRFRSFMEHAPALAWIKDSSLRYTYANRALERHHGLEATEMLGRDDFELLPADLARYFRADDEQVLNAGATQQKLRRFPLPDGRAGHWLVVKFPLADAAGAIGLAGIAIDVTSRVDAEEKARRYAEEVRDLANRLVQAQEAERRRIADGLHDLIGQNLTALGIDLQALRQRLEAGGNLASGPRIAAMAGLVETTIDAIRDVMTDLRPPALEEFGLVPALRWYASQFGKRTGMKVAVRCEGSERRLPADTELALFRIAQEALTNAGKHSGGSTAEVAIAYAQGVRLTVSDNGRGFEEREGAPAARRGGFGLPTMRERAKALGGELRVEFPERGARIVVAVP